MNKISYEIDKYDNETYIFNQKNLFVVSLKKPNNYENNIIGYKFAKRNNKWNLYYHPTK